MDVKYSVSNFKDISYSETSETGLINRMTGKQIGCFETDLNGNRKAIRVQIKGTRFLVHRVIWALEYGEIDPDLVIDHIDGNPWNNKLCNLRLVTRQLNQRNRKMLSNNKTGKNGLCFHKTSNNSGGYNEYLRVNWFEGLVQNHKDFNLKNFKDKQDAIEFGELLRELVLPDKETYTERHGTKNDR